MNRCIIAFFIVWSCMTCNEPAKQERKSFRPSDFAALNHLHKPIPSIEAGDWLSMRNETTEDFNTYRASKPHRPTSQRKTIYILPLGTFTQKEDSLIEVTSNFLRAFYGLPVIVQPALSDKIVPKKAQRIHHGAKQFHTKTIMYGYLEKKLPKDAVAYICITNTDLYPKRSWNFVFGQANWGKHVAVASMARYKLNEFDEPVDFQLIVERIMSTTAHETGHLFRLKHCATYHCLMNGSNSLEEADEKPAWLCPSCLLKLSWNLNYPPVQRFIKLEAFYHQHGFEEERAFCAKSREILTNRLTLK